MKKALVEAWIADLRSGKYKQHRGSLTDKHAWDDKQFAKAEAFCCLGVAVITDCKLNNTNPDAARFIGGVGQYLGMDNNTERQLIWMNDKEMQSFEQIAAYIEENILPNATEE